MEYLEAISFRKSRRDLHDDVRQARSLINEASTLAEAMSLRAINLIAIDLSSR
jgi:hypothetical protein